MTWQRKTAGTIDQYLKTNWDSVLIMHQELTPGVEPERTEERYHEIVLYNKNNTAISELEYT